MTNGGLGGAYSEGRVQRPPPPYNLGFATVGSQSFKVSVKLPPNF